MEIIRAEFSGSNRCEALGLVAVANAPALKLCRMLLAAGHDPESALHVYRGETLSLRIRTIREGAELMVKQPNHGSPYFSKWKPHPLDTRG